MRGRPTRASWSRVTAVAALALLAVSCGDASRRLTAMDVTGIPRGNATGSGFSGQYLITGGKIDDCSCGRPADACSTAHINVGRTFVVTQDGGAMTAMFAMPDLLYTGGVSADGTYRLGVAIDKPGDLEYLSMYGRIRVGGDGKPTGMDTTQEYFAATTDLECEIVKASFSSDYQAALK